MLLAFIIRLFCRICPGLGFLPVELDNRPKLQLKMDDTLCGPDAPTRRRERKKARRWTLFST